MHTPPVNTPQNTQPPGNNSLLADAYRFASEMSGCLFFGLASASSFGMLILGVLSMSRPQSTPLIFVLILTGLVIAMVVAFCFRQRAIGFGILTTLVLSFATPLLLFGACLAGFGR